MFLFIILMSILKLQFVLFSFRKNRSLHHERSPSTHSYYYVFSVDRPTCLVRFLLNAESLQHRRVIK